MASTNSDEHLSNGVLNIGNKYIPSHSLYGTNIMIAFIHKI